MILDGRCGVSRITCDVLLSRCNCAPRQVQQRRRSLVRLDKCLDMITSSVSGVSMLDCSQMNVVCTVITTTSKSANFLGTYRLASVDILSVLCTSNDQNSLQIPSLILHRRDTVEANQCGKKCEGPLVETKEDTRGLTCNTPVPCEFTPWTRWSHCHSHLSQRTRFRHSSRPDNNAPTD